MLFLFVCGLRDAAVVFVCVFRILCLYVCFCVVSCCLVFVCGLPDVVGVVCWFCMFGGVSLFCVV